MTTINPATLSFAYLEALRDVRYQTAALSFMVWEFLLMLGEEMDYIWRMRHCTLKWCYFYFRYVLLAAQISHLAISSVLSSGRMSDSLCTTWYRYAGFILQLSTTMIELVWVLRVYALFNRSRKVGVLLGSLILSNVCLETAHVVRSPAVKYFGTCILPLPLGDFAYGHTGVVIFVQSVLIGMIIYKRLVEVRRGWGRAPILSFLVREATSNYIAAFVLCAIALAISGVDAQRIIIVFYWSISLYSTIGCRLILNMEPFTRRDVSDDEEILFTSHISL